MDFSHDSDSVDAAVAAAIDGYVPALFDGDAYPLVVAKMRRLVGLAAPLSVKDASLMFAAPPHSRSRQCQLQPQPARSMGRQASRPSPRPTPTAGHTRHRTKPLRRVRHRRRVPSTPTKPRRRMSTPALSRRPLRRVINPSNRCDQQAGHSANIRTTTGQTDFYYSPTTGDS